MKRHIVSFATAAFFALGVSTVWAQPTQDGGGRAGGPGGGGERVASSGGGAGGGAGSTSSGGSGGGSAVSTTSSGSTGGGGNAIGWGSRPGIDFPRSSAPLRGPDAAAFSNGGQSRARGSGSSGEGRAAPRGEGGSGQGRTAPRGEGGGGQGRAVPRGEAGGGERRAVPRGEAGSATGPGAAAITQDGGGRDAAQRQRSAVPAYSRPREGRTPVGSPLDRSEAIRRGGGIGSTFYYDSFYGYPFGGSRYYSRYGFYPGFGFGLGYFYDPFWYGAGYGSYGGYGGYGGYYGSGGGGYYRSRGYDTGSLRLKVQPRDAKVYIDGYFVGLVDSFDGMFQKLAVEGGTHRVEIRADGYEPAQFEIIMTPGETITYKGELKRITP